MKIESCVKIGKIVQEYIKEFDKEFEKIGKEYEETKILMTIPGVGPFLSVLIYSEISDISRFSNSKKLSSYAGLVPSEKSSVEKIRYGRITEEGTATLRWGLNEGINKIIKQDGYMKDFYERIKGRRGKMKARVAVARKLLEWIYWMLKEKKSYNEQEEYVKGRLGGSLTQPVKNRLTE